MDQHDPARPSLSEHLYERLLAVYPPRHRRQYGPLMLQLFRDQYRDAVRDGRRWRLWWHVGADLASTAGVEQLAALREIIMDKHTGRLNSGSTRGAGVIVASLLVAVGLIGKSLIYQFGGSPVLAMAVMFSTQVVASLIIDVLLEARGTAFMLMALLIGAALLPLLWVPDGAVWLRENPLLGGVFVVVLAGWYQTGRARWPMFAVAGILAVAQVLVSFI
jgi:hypothetical protein